MISPRRQFYLVWLVIGPVGLLAIGLLIAFVSGYFMLLLLGWVHWVACMLRDIECPLCGRWIAWGRLPWRSGEDRGWKFPLTYCETCGTDLREPRTRQDV